MDKDFKRNNFDLLRLAAASQVLLTHVAEHLNLSEPRGWSVLEALPGVPIFFVISGFLVSASLERAQNLRRYFGNRASRIFPALWCCLALTVLTAALCGHDVFVPAAVPWMLAQAAGLIYTPGFLKGFGTGSYNGSLWTIPIELQFYLLLPLLYAGIARLPGGRTRWICLAFVLCIVIAATLRHVVPGLGVVGGPESLGDRLVRYSLLPHLYLFLAGILLQQWRAYRWRVLRGKGLYWLACYLALSLGTPSGELRHLAASLVLAVATVSLAYTAPDLAARLLRHQDLSYGAYIYHGLLLNLFLEAGWRGRWSHLLWIAVLSYAAAWISWRFVEQPALRRKRVQALSQPVPAG